MKKCKMKLFSALMVAVFTLQSVYAADSIIIKDWNEPTDAQIQEAVENRLPLPAEDSSESFVAPNRAVKRYYTNVEFTKSIKNQKYNPIGYASYTNTSSESAVLEYMQANTVTTSWNVTGNVSGSTEISVPVIAKIQATFGVQVGKSTTTAGSSQALARLNVPSGKTGTIYAYHGAMEVQGKILWQEADENGTVYATGWENIGGAFIMTGVHFINELE